MASTFVHRTRKASLAKRPEFGLFILTTYILFSLRRGTRLIILLYWVLCTLPPWSTCVWDSVAVLVASPSPLVSYWVSPPSSARLSAHTYLLAKEDTFCRMPKLPWLSTSLTPWGNLHTVYISLLVIYLTIPVSSPLLYLQIQPSFPSPRINTSQLARIATKQKYQTLTTTTYPPKNHPTQPLNITQEPHRVYFPDANFALQWWIKPRYSSHGSSTIVPAVDSRSLRGSGVGVWVWVWAIGSRI